MLTSRSSACCAVLLVALAARASTGVCDSNPPTTTQACIDAIQASGGVVNDVFKDFNGRTAQNLPAFGKVINIYPSCATMNCAGCNPGVSQSPFDCPGEYVCNSGTACTLATVGAGVNALDRQWGHPCRLTQHTLVNGCPQYGTCVADGDPQAYFPWEGLVFDLGGPSNQVAIFAENDHGPQPCESAEYTVFLTNDPQSQDIILHPTTTGADPRKWNRAVLKKVFTKGFVEVRPPDPAGHASCGDTSLYSVEEDSMVTVYGLPCGINFRYAAIVAGNDGVDFPACQYHSSEAELDAVAGLTEQGAGVCPDADLDGYPDCGCQGAPAVCDCDDADPNVHPNAPEPCNATKDLNCNTVHPEPCPAGQACAAGLCVDVCTGSELGCPLGAECTPLDAGLSVCVAHDCATGGCPPGSVCDSATNTCRVACDQTVVCPFGQHCVSGECIDRCKGVTCAVGFTCVDGTCTPPCSCFADNAGCGTGTVCDRPVDGGAPATNLCLTPSCVGVPCAAGQHCASGACVGYCDGVQCPPNEVCVPPDAGAKAGCVNLCAGVTCGAGTKCELTTGACVSDGTQDAGGPGADAGTGGGTDAGGKKDAGTSGPGSISAKPGCGCGAAEAGAMAFAVALGLSWRRRPGPAG